MRIQTLILTGALVLMMPACFATQFGIPSFVNIINNGGVGRSGNAESPDMVTGKACATSYLGYFAIGDASVRAAAREEGINEIASVSHTTEGALGIMAEYCTIVRGWK
ncbi:MAG: TRL-like family protein [Leptospiraceae bacterium]